ncbi:MAG: NUDIX domain-containing protein [Candidatus Pacebacteria bacterium]|nr:NUDIX domain-containing protein [Candidatus Paceibacterota bacterium]
MVHKETVKVAVVAGVVIKKGNTYLLVQEKQLRAYGLWNLPGGRVDEGESIEEAAIRETKEESGYVVELVQQLKIFHAKATDVVKHSFEAKIIGGELHFPDNEILDAGWFSFDEILEMKDKLRSEWVIESINILEKIGH